MKSSQWYHIKNTQLISIKIIQYTMTFTTLSTIVNLISYQHQDSLMICSLMRCIRKAHQIVLMFYRWGLTQWRISQVTMMLIIISRMIHLSSLSSISFISTITKEDAQFLISLTIMKRSIITVKWTTVSIIDAIRAIRYLGKLLSLGNMTICQIVYVFLCSVLMIITRIQFQRSSVK